MFERQLIGQAELDQLTNAYIYLRKLEHRLQYWEDAQTHHLPGDDASQQRLGIAMGHATLDDFKKQLAQHRDNVAKLFADAFVLKKHQAEVDEDGVTWNLDGPGGARLQQGWKREEDESDVWYVHDDGESAWDPPFA